MIGIIDYGAGNLHSIEKAIKKLGFTTKIMSKPDEFHGINKIIFPGVGNAGKTMQIIKKLGMDKQIKKCITEGVPFLGICLGMQLLLEFSKENETDCLSIFEGTVIPFHQGVKVPHMGWNEVQQIMKHPIYKGIPDRCDFYFVHSFYVQPLHESDVIGLTNYSHDFCSVIARDNVIGVQFHPEKVPKPD
ncbi:imidazole glycerol phosphate synthase subunit HisH [Pueribacillus theae]|uniref:Imidazole glycerol phosphate synthase subunit HisH n=1 Tax=Pueribacillus theae TaxID=2171751 RepID=A0A2U1K6I5_9BACI|nr:imidazole glycerol phosphate synthase subunit HisH [Pueribacillus theae]PWA13137.1 imidazole glycerol phosphate synthase subunit HisH [Pueribacillus theae]